MPSAVLLVDDGRKKIVFSLNHLLDFSPKAFFFSSLLPDLLPAVIITIHSLHYMLVDSRADSVSDEQAFIKEKLMASFHQTSSRHNRPHREKQRNMKIFLKQTTDNLNAGWPHEKSETKPAL